MTGRCRLAVALGAAGALVAIVVTAPAAAAASTRWASPVHGEPTGFALDGDSVAVAGFERLQVLDSADGSTRWEVEVDGLAPVRPAIGTASVVVGGSAGVLGFDRETGAPRFVVAFPGASRVALATVAAGSAVAVAGSTGSGALLALDPISGARRWSVAFPERLLIGPVAGHGPAESVVAGIWRDDAGPRLRVLDLATGALRFDQPVRREPAAPVVAGPTVFLADGDGNFSARVRALDAATGAERWSTALPASFEPDLEPGLEGDDLVVVDHFGRVTLLDVDTGEIRWQRATRAAAVQSPVAFAGSRVAFAAYPNRVVVLDRGRGTIVARLRSLGATVDLAGDRGRVLVALRVARPSRVEARPWP